MIGDQADVVSRQKQVLPPRWFTGPDSNGNSQTPVLDSLLNGVAAVGSWLYSLFQYVTNQTRLQTSTDGWLEISALDYFGPGGFPRLSGETDGAYAARIQANLLPRANTRENIQQALETLTGFPVRMIAPWDPRDTAVWGYRTFWGVDLDVAPGNWSNGKTTYGNGRYQGFVECVLPTTQNFGSTPQARFWLGAYWFNTAPPAAGWAWWWNGQNQSGDGGATLVYNLIQKLKVFGTIVWLKFVTPAAALSDSPSFSLLTDDFGAVLEDDSGNELTT